MRAVNSSLSNAITLAEQGLSTRAPYSKNPIVNLPGFFNLKS